MLALIFLLILVVFYISATIEMQYLWFLVLLFVGAYLVKRKTSTPKQYLWSVALCCIPGAIAVIGLDIAAVYQVVNNRYFAELDLMFAILGTALLVALGSFVFSSLKKSLTPAKQVAAQVLVIVNFAGLAYGLDIAASNKEIADSLPGLSSLAQYSFYLPLVAGVVFAVYNSLLARQ